MKRQYRKYKWVIVTIFSVIINLFTHYFSVHYYNGSMNINQNELPFARVSAQTLTPEVVSREVYQQIPNFPLENNYLNVETNQVVSENTLVSRIVRYHQYVKSRPTVYRLDWKLTLADYLGKNEIMDEQRYPSSTITENPLEKDKQVIKSLTRQQRNELVNVLVSIYNPENQEINQESTQNQQKTPSSQSPSFQLPKPGNADLLLP